MIFKLRWLALIIGFSSIFYAYTNSPTLGLANVSNLALASSNYSLKTVSNTPSEVEIWSLLKQETGYVILIRHALAPGTGDPANFQLGNCPTQRNLSNVGREQAVQIGREFRERQIPIDKVLSSEWCRCLETSELMDIAPVESFSALNSIFRDRSTQKERTTQLRQFILNNRNPSSTVILVTHSSNISAISNVSVQSGGMVVLKANGRDQIDLIGQIEAI